MELIKEFFLGLFSGLFLVAPVLYFVCTLWLSILAVFGLRLLMRIITAINESF